ncbi:hypothetical protein AB0C65_24210 [Nocardia sp. NPDC048505]|uniref:hypothetical protein n=1 Tax=Nocardia sp. NPDC048505 TaxID=3155756 RepID=UPI0033DEF8E1
MDALLAAGESVRALTCRPESAGVDVAAVVDGTDEQPEFIARYHREVEASGLEWTPPTSESGWGRGVLLEFSECAPGRR